MMRCDYCPETFKSVLAWSKHISQELQYNITFGTAICPNCKINFSTMQRLSIHMHTRVCRDSSFPRDQCNHCEKYFTSQFTLARHMKNYVCYTQEEAAALLAYQYTCFVCFKSFNEQSHLLRHSQVDDCIKRKHKNYKQVLKQITPNKIRKAKTPTKKVSKRARMNNHDTSDNWLNDVIDSLVPFDSMDQMDSEFIREIFI